MLPWRLTRFAWVMIVLSMIWAFGAALHTHTADVRQAETSAEYSYKVCSFGKAVHHDTDLTSCDAERAKTFNLWMEHSTANAAIVALAPIPFAWLGGFILLYVARAQIAGFRAVLPWTSLTRWKKLFVAFCALTSFATLLVGVVMILNLYVDNKVPVSPSPFLDVTQFGDLVTVAGTWTRSDLTDDTIMNPLQTSKIECNKGKAQCVEALASVSGTVLIADVVDYDIQSWTPSAIVLRRDYPCATELFTIDLNTKAVTGAGHAINGNDPQCKMNERAKSNWTYQLSRGFNVYWGLRQKARPLLLRLIQALFNN